MSLIRWLRTPVPFTFRTFVLAYLMGCLLSVPFGVLIGSMLGEPLVEVPACARKRYGCSLVASFFLLAFWSLVVFRRVPVLRKLGLIFFFALLLVLLLMVMFFSSFAT